MTGASNVRNHGYIRNLEDINWLAPFYTLPLFLQRDTLAMSFFAHKPAAQPASVDPSTFNVESMFQQIMQTVQQSVSIVAKLGFIR